MEERQEKLTKSSPEKHQKQRVYNHRINYLKMKNKFWNFVDKS